MMKEVMEVIKAGMGAWEKHTENNSTLLTIRPVMEDLSVVYVIDTNTKWSNDGLFKSPDVLGVVVGEGNKAKVYGTKYPYSLYAEQSDDMEVQAFFGGSMDKAKSLLQNAVAAKLIGVLEKMHADGKLQAEDEYLADLDSAWKSDRLRDAVIARKRPMHSSITVEVDEATVLQSIVDELHDRTTTIDKVAQRYMDGKAWEGARECYAYEIALINAYDEKMRNPLPEDTLAQAISDAFKTAKDKGAKNVVLEVLGRDENIPPYTKNRFPDFHIEGKVIRGKYDAEFPRFELKKLGSAYHFTPDKPLKERYGNRNEQQLHEIWYADIVRISYKGKTLYENADLVKQLAEAALSAPSAA